MKLIFKFRILNPADWAAFLKLGIHLVEKTRQKLQEQNNVNFDKAVANNNTPYEHDRVNGTVGRVADSGKSITQQKGKNLTFAETWGSIAAGGYKLAGWHLETHPTAEEGKTKKFLYLEFTKEGNEQSEQFKDQIAEMQKILNEIHFANCAVWFNREDKPNKKPANYTINFGENGSTKKDPEYLQLQPKGPIFWFNIKPAATTESGVELLG